jgi:hypothetical protein
MVIIRTDSWEHRVLLNGLIESRCATIPIKGIEEWQIRSPDSMGMTGGEYAIVREHLLALSNIFREQHWPLPSTETTEELPVNGMQPR